MTYYTDAGSGIKHKDYSHIAIVSKSGSYYKRFYFMTINQVELRAILICAKTFANEGDMILSDSKWSVDAINYNWNVTKDNVKDVFKEAIEIIKNKKIKLKWIPREENLAGHYLEKKYKQIIEQRNGSIRN
jgi:ribonuclease HI